MTAVPVLGVTVVKSVSKVAFDGPQLLPDSTMSGTACLLAKALGPGKLRSKVVQRPSAQIPELPILAEKGGWYMAFLKTKKY